MLVLRVVCRLGWSPIATWGVVMALMPRQCPAARPLWGQGSNEIVLSRAPSALVGQRVNVRVHSCRQALYYQLGRLP